MNALAYVRVSTDSQETDRQISAVSQYCSAVGLNLKEIIREAEAASGRSSAARRAPSAALAYYAALAAGDFGRIERPGYAELLDKIRAAAGTYDKITHVVFYALDRLSRDAVELLLLERLLASLDCVLVAVNAGGSVDTRTASGWLQLAFQAVIAEHECRQISERTRATLKVKAEHIRLGRPLVGWKKVNNRYVVDSEKWPLVQSAAALREQGRNYREIADALGVSPGMVKSYLAAAKFKPTNQNKED